MTDYAKKMEWKRNQLKNGTFHDVIYDTGEDCGAIRQATGTGKAGRIIDNIIQRIMEAGRNAKMIFNLSCPMLNLCEQLSGDLILGVLKFVFKNEWDNGEFLILVNSSMDIAKYKKEFVGENCVVDKFSNMDNALNENKNVRFVIVISCHESLENFARQVKKLLKKGWYIANYLDEAHTLVNFKNKLEYEKKYDKLEDDEKERYDMLDRLMDCQCVYAFSATHDRLVTKCINSKLRNINHRDDENYFIVDIPPRDSINNGEIVDVHPKYIIDKKEPLNAECAINFMMECKQDNPFIPHKILITCNDSDHLKSLESGLMQNGYKVFSTCAKYGISPIYNGEDEDVDGNFKNISSHQFVSEIDKYSQDCFVLHIRQLTAGIDIKSLTDCIICNGGAKIGDGIKIRYIQIIGRILRVLEGERPESLKEQGKTFDDRLKKYGTVLFRLTEGTDLDRIKRQIGALLVDYYGLKGGLVFNHNDLDKEYGDRSRKGEHKIYDFEKVFYDLDLQTRDMMVDIKKYIEEKIIPTCDKMNENKLFDKGNASIINESVKNIMSAFRLGNYNNDNLEDYNHPVREIISRDDVMSAVTELFKKHNAINN